MSRSTTAGIAGLSLAASFALVVACGSDGSSGGSSPDGGAGSSSGGSSSGGSSGGGGSSSGGCAAQTGGVDLATYADRICKAFTPCCPNYGYPIDPARCVKNFTMSAPDLVFDPVKAEQCVLTWEANAKKDTFCRDTPTPPVCLDIWKRCATAGPPASPCENRVDCALSPEGTVSCEGRTFDKLGVCRLEVHGKLGDPCDGWAPRVGDSPDFVNSGPPAGTTRVGVCYLEEGLYCDHKTGKCAARQDVGGACVFDPWCIDGLICEGGVDTSKCEPKRTNSQPCFDSRDCAPELYCDATKQCVPKKPLGAQCEKFDACIHKCESGTCVDKPSVGALYGIYCGFKDGG